MAKMDDVKRTPAVAVTVTMNSERVDDPNNSLRLTFANGAEHTLRLGDLRTEVLAYAVLHGLKQKLVDAAAISRNPDTGRSATAEDKYLAVKVVFDRLVNEGLWNAPRGEGGTGTGGLLFRALVRMYPAKTPAALREFLAGKTASEQAALRKNPRVAAIIEEIKAEDVDGEGEDTSDALLDELE